MDLPPYTVLLWKLQLCTYRTPSPHSWETHCFAFEQGTHWQQREQWQRDRWIYHVLRDLVKMPWTHNLLTTEFCFLQSWRLRSPKSSHRRLGFGESLLVVHAQVVEGEHSFLWHQLYLGKFNLITPAKTSVPKGITIKGHSLIYTFWGNTHSNSSIYLDRMLDIFEYYNETSLWEWLVQLSKVLRKLPMF